MNAVAVSDAVRASTDNLNALLERRTALKEELAATKERLTVLRKGIKKATPIEVKGVIRGKYAGHYRAGDLKRDQRFVLLLFRGTWRLATWAAKTKDGKYVVQTLPAAAMESSDSYTKQLAKYPPRSREWYVIDSLEAPPNCLNIIITAANAKITKNLYSEYDKTKSLPEVKNWRDNTTKPVKVT